MEIKQLNQRTHLIAYIDILGTSEMLLNNEGDRLVKTVCDAYQLWMKISAALKAKVHIDIRFKTFSDNIVLSCPFDNQNPDEKTVALDFFLSAVCLYQGSLLKDNRLLSRGGICIGDLLSDDSLVLGTGLLDAYHLESHIAFYPRIVASVPFVDTLQKLLPRKAETHICRDRDGEFYANFASTYSKEDFARILLLSMRKIEKMQSEKRPNLRAIQNYRWICDALRS